MKKLFLLISASMCLIGCSSNGSSEIQINEVDFVPGFNNTIEESAKVKNIFEVVPGNYKISWSLTTKAPGVKNFDVSIKLKLRLNKKVNVKKEIFDEVNKEDFYPYSLPVFMLIDADGKAFKAGNPCGLSEFEIGAAKNRQTSHQFIDKDKIMDFLRFLQSEPGTEIEIETIAWGQISGVSHFNFKDDIKNAKGMICEILTDKDFERFYGIIN